MAVIPFLTFICITVAAARCERTDGASASSVSRIATMQSARAAHTATALTTGHVLLAGGMGDGGASLDAVELFDPSRNVVQALSPMIERRMGHTATLLPGGRVLVAGGYNGEYLASLEAFDPSTRRFEPAGFLKENRSGHTATLLPDGRVLLVGGVGTGWTFRATAEVYDPNTRESESVGSLSVPRESHTATLLDDGRVLITGGHAGRRPNMEVHASAEVFSLRSGRFAGAGLLTTPRHKHDAVKLADGRVLIIGGADRTDRNHFSTTEIFDPHKSLFSVGPSMANRRYKIAGTSVLLPGGDILVTSGARVLEILDSGSGRFRVVEGSLPEAFRFAAAAALPAGDVLITGGYTDDNQNTAGIWLFRR